jgi:hypothetical protein
MKRIKSAACLQACIILAVALILSACAAEKPVPRNPVPVSPSGEYIANRVAQLEISAPAEAGWMVRGACAGNACELLAQVERPTPAAADQCPFPAADTSAPEPAADRQARAAPAVGGNDNVENVKPEEKEVAPVGAYQKPAYRTVPEYKKREK